MKSWWPSLRRSRPAAGNAYSKLSIGDCTDTSARKVVWEIAQLALLLRIVDFPEQKSHFEHGKNEIGDDEQESIRKGPFPVSKNQYQYKNTAGQKLGDHGQ